MGYSGEQCFSVPCTVMYNGVQCWSVGSYSAVQWSTVALYSGCTVDCGFTVKYSEYTVDVKQCQSFLGIPVDFEFSSVLNCSCNF